MYLLRQPKRVARLRGYGHFGPKDRTGHQKDVWSNNGYRRRDARRRCVTKQTPCVRIRCLTHCVATLRFGEREVIMRSCQRRCSDYFEQTWEAARPLITVDHRCHDVNHTHRHAMWALNSSVQGFGLRFRMDRDISRTFTTPVLVIDMEIEGGCCVCYQRVIALRNAKTILKCKDCRRMVCKTSCTIHIRKYRMCVVYSCHVLFIVQTFTSCVHVFLEFLETFGQW